MKLWEILRDGQHGAVYRAVDGVESWVGTEIQFQSLDLGKQVTSCIVYARPPKIRNANASVGKSVTLSGGAILADWEFIEMRGIIFQNAETSMSDLACYVSQLLSVASRKPSVGSNSKLILQKKNNIVDTITDVLQHLNRERTNKFSDDEDIQQEFYMNCDKVIDYLRKVQRYMHDWDETQTVEYAEQIISLAYYMHKTWWGIEGWNEKNDSILSEDEMMMIARSIL